MPKNILLKYKASKSNAELSDFFKANEIVILRRKLDCGLISKSQFFAEYNNLPPYKKKQVVVEETFMQRQNKE